MHISAFDRNIPRQPKLGDTIFYHVISDQKGKLKAADAAIEGAAAVNNAKMGGDGVPCERQLCN